MRHSHECLILHNHGNRTDCVILKRRIHNRRNALPVPPHLQTEDEIPARKRLYSVHRYRQTNAQIHSQDGRCGSLQAEAGIRCRASYQHPGELLIKLQAPGKDTNIADQSDETKQREIQKLSAGLMGR